MKCGAICLMVFGILLLVSLVQGCSKSNPISVSPRWEGDVRLTFTAALSQLSYNFSRCIAADDHGNIHIVWYEASNGTSQIYYKRSLDGGTSWGFDIRLSPSQGIQENPAVAISGSNVYVVWHEMLNGQFIVFLKRSTDGGTSWESTISLTVSGKSAVPSISASGQNVHVAWGDNRDGNAEMYTRRSTDGGLSWQSEIRISDVPYESWVPTIAVADDLVCAGWVDYRDANEEEYFRRSTDGGMTWGPIIRLTVDAADSWAPSITISDGNVHITWFDRRDAGLTDTDVEKLLDATMLLVGLSPDPAPPRDPSIYYLHPFTQRIQSKLSKIQQAVPRWVQQGGNPQQFESKFRTFEQMMKQWSTGWEIYYKRSTDFGISWGPDVRLTTAVDVSARPSLAVSGSDLHVVWFDGRDGNSEVYYKHSFDGGESWGPDTRLTAAAGESIHPMISISQNVVHVIWSDQRDGNAEIYYRRLLR